MKYIKLYEDHYVPENIVREYDSKIFKKTSYGIGISIKYLKEYLEKYFGVTFGDSSDLHLEQPEQGRYSLSIELSSLGQMIDSKTWQKLAEEFSEFEWVEDTSEDTNKNRFILDLREGIEYDLEVKEDHMFQDYDRKQARKDLGKNPVKGSSAFRKEFERSLNSLVSDYRKKLDAEDIHDILEIIYNQSKNFI